MLGPKRGVSRAIVLIAVILVVIIVIGAAYLVFQNTGATQSSSTTSSSSSTSSSSTSSSPTSSSSVSTSSSSSSSVSASSSTASNTGTVPSSIAIDDSGPPATFDPVVEFLPQGVEVIQYADLPLVFYTIGANGQPNYNQLQPVLAKSWTESTDGKTYTFVLRNDVYFSNGDPFNAYAVWYNVYRGLFLNIGDAFVFSLYFNTTGVTLDNVNALNNPQNTPDANLMKVMQNPHNAVTVINATALQFHLTNAFVPFLFTLTDTPWRLYDPYIVSQHGGVVANQPNTWMVANGTTVGDGPYVLQTYVSNQYSILVANPHYWAQNMTDNVFLKPAQIKTVTINYKPDELTRVLDLQTNRVQGAVVSFTDINQALSGHSNLFVPNTGLTVNNEYVFMNTLKSPLNNTVLRQAIIAGVNVSEIIQAAFNGYSTPFQGPTPKGSYGYNDSIKPPAYNMTLAKQLLAKAGFPNGQGLPPLTLGFIASSTYQTEVVTIMQSDLAKIGVMVTPVGYNYNTWGIISTSNGTLPGEPNMVVDYNFAWPDFAAYEFEIMSLPPVNFWTFFNNATITNLIVQSYADVNPAHRLQLISMITSLAEQQSPVLWIGTDLNEYSTGIGFGPMIFNKCLTGFWNSADQIGPPYNALTYTCTPS